MKYAALIGIRPEGDMICVGLAAGNEIEKLLAQREAIAKAGGKIGTGKSAAQLSELVLLASQTSGGELRSRLRF